MISLKTLMKRKRKRTPNQRRKERETEKTSRWASRKKRNPQRSDRRLKNSTLVKDPSLRYAARVWNIIVSPANSVDSQVKNTGATVSEDQEGFDVVKADNYVL